MPEVGEPVVTAVSPSSVVAGGPSFTITVTGQNFAQGDTVEWDFVPLTSTFVSSTKMTAIVPNQQISHAASHSVIVQTPSPYPLTFGTNVAVTDPPAPGNAGFSLSTVNVQANDIVWDAVSQQLYLSVSAMDATHPNTITALNPVTAHFGASVGAGSGADHVVVSSDGSWLYAGIPKDGSIQRFTLPSLATDITISLGSVSSQRYYALDLEAAPGSPNTIAVSQVTTTALGASTNEGVVVYDGLTPRSVNVTSVHGPLGSLAWNSNGSSLYAAYGRGAGQDTLFVLSANSAGVQLVNTDNLNTGSQVIDMGNVHYSALTGYVFSDLGQIIDPSTNKQINTLPVAAIEGGNAYFTPVLALDDTLGLVWAVEEPANNPQYPQYVIEGFDLRTNALLGSIAIPNVAGTPVKLIRWGANGLAFLTSANGSQQGGVYILSGAFVTNPTVQLRAPTASND